MMKRQSGKPHPEKLEDPQTGRKRNVRRNAVHDQNKY
jgi:hypothetical protein